MEAGHNNLKKANHTERVRRKATGLSPRNSGIGSQGCQAKIASLELNFARHKKFSQGDVVMLKTLPISQKKHTIRKCFSLSILILTFSMVTFFIVLLGIPDAHAAEITLAWDQNSEPDIAGYRIYYGQESHSYTNVVDVGNYTSCVIADLEDGETYYFVATAYNTDGFESGYSNEISNGEPETPDDGDGGAAGSGSSGGGGSCFIDTAACGFPVAQLKESTRCGLSKIKCILQHIIFHD